MTQKKLRFRRGDLVRVADPLPDFMRHFDGAGQQAVVQYGEITQEQGNYSLYFPSLALSASWYPEDTLNLIAERSSPQLDLLDALDGYEPRSGPERSS